MYCHLLKGLLTYNTSKNSESINPELEALNMNIGEATCHLAVILLHSCCVSLSPVQSLFPHCYSSPSLSVHNSCSRFVSPQTGSSSRYMGQQNSPVPSPYTPQSPATGYIQQYPHQQPPSYNQHQQIQQGKSVHAWWIWREVRMTVDDYQVYWQHIKNISVFNTQPFHSRRYLVLHLPRCFIYL